MTRGSRVALPHLVLGPQDVRCDPEGGWRVLEASPLTPQSIVYDGDVVESWDAQKPLRFERVLTLPPDFAAGLGLVPAAARFVVVVVGATGRGVHRQILCREEANSGNTVLRLEVSPSGDSLLRDLSLSTAVVLLDPGAGGEPLAPSEPGARVWEDEVRLQLEGGRARLPMQAVSFSSIPAFRGFENALFHVHVADDGEHEIEQGLLVFLNSDQLEFIARVEACESAAIALLHDGVVRRVLREVLSHDLVAGDMPGDGTVGGTASRWVELAFRGHSMQEVAALAREQPAAFDAAVESWCDSVQGLFRTRRGQ